MASMLLSTIFQCAHDVERDTTSKKKKRKLILLQLQINSFLSGLAVFRVQTCVR